MEIMRVVSDLVATRRVDGLASTSLRVLADEKGKLIFEDSFDRNESQETKDEIGNGWGINSKSRAGGNKQADLRDGALEP